MKQLLNKKMLHQVNHMVFLCTQLRIQEHQYIIVIKHIIPTTYFVIKC